MSNDDPPREVPCDLMTWARWFEENDRRIRATQIKRGVVEGPWVSTIFIGLDHRFGFDGPPLLYETMVFKAQSVWHEPSELWPEGHWGVGDELDCQRHATWADAIPYELLCGITNREPSEIAL